MFVLSAVLCRKAFFATFSFFLAAGQIGGISCLFGHESFRANASGPTDEWSSCNYKAPPLATCCITIKSLFRHSYLFPLHSTRTCLSAPPLPISLKGILQLSDVTAGFQK
jgi:hypothetical protein